MSINYLWFLLLLIVIWSLFSILAKFMRFDRKGIIIYPLIIIVKSGRFLQLIENEAKRREKFWRFVSKVSPVFLWFLLVSSTLYFIINLYYLSQGLVSVRGGIPIGAQLIPIIPFITVSGKILLYILIASMIAIIPHEISHGVIAVRSGIKIKSTGFFFLLGAIIGAFVELPEEELTDLIDNRKKKDDVIKVRNLKKILAAGIFFNMILFSVFYGIMLNYNTVMSPFFEINGVKVVSVDKQSPAEKAGLAPGVVIIKINNTEIHDINTFIDYMKNVSPGNILILHSLNGEKYVVKTSVNPNNVQKPYLGIVIMNHYKSKIPFIPDSVYIELFNFIYLSMLLQFIIIVTNALPIFVSDGAKFLLISLRERVRNKNIADLIYLSINWLCLIILIANFILPLVK